MIDHNPIEKQKFVSVDMMRGIAILMVMLGHTSQRVKGLVFLQDIFLYGQMGVQLFFVASAFTLCYSLDIRRTNEPIQNFYIRRLFRIAPAYYVGFLIYFVIAVLLEVLRVNNVWVSSYNIINVLSNVFFLHGLYPSANNSVVPGGWSVGTEMLFYLVFPLVYKIYKVLQAKFKYTYLVMPVVALCLSVFIQYIAYTLTNKPIYFTNNGFIYYTILNQMPVFCIGISLYFAHKNGYLKAIKLSTSFGLFLALSCISGYLMTKGISLFVFVNSIAPFIAALSFVFLFIMLQNYNAIRNRKLIRLGVLSYSCYLLHFIFTFYIVDFLSKKMTFIQPDLALILFSIMTVTLTYLSAGLMHKYVELNGVKLGKHIILNMNKKSRSNNASSEAAPVRHS